MKSKIMWRQVIFIVATCCFSICKSTAVKPISCDDISVRNFVSYHLTSWQHAVGGIGMKVVENSESGIAALDLTGNEYVAIVVHGRESGIYTEFGNTLKHSLITADKQMVVILIDWSFLSFVPYEDAVSFVPCVSHEIRSFIENMMSAAKLNRNRLHLIGFDLGVHIVGIASRNSIARAAKITALDPAGDRWGAESLRLRATDAQLVEVIHTNGNGALGSTAYGIGEPIGTLDFFPNGGDRQPGCGIFDNACHHKRAWQLFAGTVDTGGHLIAMKCQNMTQVNNNLCVMTPAAIMGTLALVKFNTGLHRVNTGSIYPY
ncbi:lipase member I-like isoform X2 [Cydia pomonella]|uniref:lipase member I-like isoform X1 n=1 Tax=Cydia pomonella TaxID=82600 RepID=UPI002ADE223E|nr:lipase member I-like isoform X1 [Cydia pomonella]XP_061706210.1 lipase member I-like isoform X2 [Cydia pomonella]